MFPWLGVPDVTSAVPLKQALHHAGNLLFNLTMAAVVIFFGWYAFRAVSASRVHLPVTSGQHAFAERYCVSEVGGALGSAYVSKPDLLGTTGPTPRLVIRCTFGPKAYLMKIVDLSRANETPDSGS